MLKELNSPEEINEYFEKLNNSPVAAFNKSRLYGMAKSYQDLLEKEKPVRDYYDKNKHFRLLEVYIVSDDISIAKTEYKTTNKGIQTFYVPFINGLQISECAYSFDMALIVALAHKYNESGATPYIAKILGIGNDSL